VKTIFGFLIIGILLFVSGCGGNGGSAQSNFDYSIKKVNTSGSQKIALTQENARDFFQLTKDFFPEASKVSRTNAQEMIAYGSSLSQECDVDGSVSQLITKSSNQIRLDYQNCMMANGITTNGTQAFELEHSGADFYFLKDFKISSGDKTITYNMVLKIYTKKGVKRWDYYIKATGDVPTGSLEVNLYIAEDSNRGEVTYEGTYLLGNHTFFQIQSSGLTPWEISWLGPTTIELYEKALDQGSRIMIVGKNSSFSTIGVENDTLYVLNRAGTKSYWVSLDQAWTSDWERVVENYYEPTAQFFINNRESLADSPVQILDANNVMKFYFEITDLDSYKDETTVSMELIEKPSESHATLEKTNWKYSEAASHDGDTDRYPEEEFHFDKDGTYTFKLTIKDGSWEEEFTYSVFYSNTALSSSQHIFNGYIADTTYIPNTHQVAILHTSPDYNITIIDANNDVVSQYTLPDAPSKMVLDSNHSLLAISSDQKVFLVDANNTEELNLTRTYAVPEDLGQILIDNGYVYTMKKTGSWVYLYSLRLSDGNCTKNTNNSITSSSSLILNSEQKALYTLDAYNPTTVEKFDLSHGEAIHNSPSLDFNSDRAFPTHIWRLNNEKVITQCGTILFMSTQDDHDMEVNGTLSSPHIDCIENKGIRTVHYHPDTQKSVITYSTRLEYRYHTSDKNDILNTFEVRSAVTMNVLAHGNLKKYFEKDGILYWLFVEKAFLMDGDHLFVLYRAVPDNQYYHDTDNDVFVYEIKNINQ